MSPNELRSGFLLVLMFIVMALLDIIGVASIMPFIYVLSNPEILETNVLLKEVFQASSRFGVENTQQFLLFLGIIFFVLLVVSLTFKAITTYVQAHFGQMLEYRIAKRLMEGYLYQPYSWFLNRNSADLGKNILSEVGLVVGGGLKPVINLIAQMTIAFALLMLIVFANPKLALIVGFTLSLAFVVIYRFTRGLLNHIGDERVINNKLRFRALSEAFGAVKEIKLGGLEKSFIQRFSDAAKVIAKHNAMHKVISVLPRFAVEAIAFGGMIIVALYLMSQSDNFANVLPTLALYAFAGYRLMPALQAIYSDFTELRFAGPMIDIMYDDVKSLKPISYHKNEDALPLKKAITLNHIHYNYPNASKVALKNIQLNIPAYSTVGIVGTTGSGKTTTVDIILGLLEVQQGTLEIDGKVINKDNSRAWQRSIGYVPQQIYVADDTVAANIAFGIMDSNDINQEAVERAAKIANLHDFVINELPQQYKTTVGERGVRLSGGQRQRIGIARAMYHNPQVLILDEATSALDNLTEKAVMEEEKKIGKKITIIMIAHRLTTVKECDTIFLLEKGELKAQGTFKKLIEVSEQFRASTSKM